MWCPCPVRPLFDCSRWPDVMGIGHEDTTDIPARQEMQGMDGGAVVGPGGQHAEPVKAVYELSGCLAVAAEVFRKFHVGSRDLSHLQDYLDALDLIDGLCPHGTGHQPVQAFLPLEGKPALQKKIPLHVREDGAVMYGLSFLVHNPWFLGVTAVSLASLDPFDVRKPVAVPATDLVAGQVAGFVPAPECRVALAEPVADSRLVKHRFPVGGFACLFPRPLPEGRFERFDRGDHYRLRLS